jgi:hypothetical protein
VSGCPELEALVLAQSEHDPDALAHLRNCPDCAALVEDHRQQDLFRLVDPLPPPDLVSRVMARVAAEPAPVRLEMKTALSILALALMAAVLTFVANHGNIGLLGARAASGVVAWRHLLMGAGEAMTAIWSTAALPFVVAMAGLVISSVWGLRRLAAHRVVEVEVRP